MSFWRRIVDLNREASRRFAGWARLPTDKTFWTAFEAEVQDEIRGLSDGATVVDVGGGRRCVYHHALRPGIELVATDVSADELALNPHATRTLVADVAQGLALPDASVELVVSRAVLEHVSDVRAAARSMERVLKPGGKTMHLLPGRFSLFALAARTLPFKPLLNVVHHVMPETVDQVEFDVFYDQGTPARLRRAFEDAGFRDVRVQVTWAQPGYFETVFPAFLLYSLYECVVRTLRLRTLAAYVVVTATR